MVNRGDVIAYLLHQMSEADRAAFAERSLDDADLHAQVRAVEADLFDDYARGRLSPDERTRLERYLLGSTHQQQKLALAEALARTFPARAPTAASRLLVAAAAIIVVLAGTAAWFGQQSLGLRQEVAAARANAAPIAPPGQV